MTSPAMALPLGWENSPTIERIRPSNQSSQPMIGIHPSTSPKTENTNPAVAVWLLLGV